MGLVSCGGVLRLVYAVGVAIVEEVGRECSSCGALVGGRELSFYASRVEDRAMGVAGLEKLQHHGVEDRVVE